MRRSAKRRGVAAVVLAGALLGASCTDDGADPTAGTAAPPATTTPEAGDPAPWYAPAGWPAIHHDAANSDAVALADPAEDLSPSFHVLAGSVIGAVLTTDAEGTVYATTATPTAEGCTLVALDPATGGVRWCSDELGPRVVSSSVTVDVDGDLYVADDAAMTSFTADGELRWSTPIDGNPLSSQLTPDGHLIFISHIGHIYVVDRSTGAVVVEHDLLPEVDYDPATAQPIDCLVGGADSTCYSANTLAVDASGRFVFTFAPPGRATASVIAMDYVGGEAPAIEPAWENGALEGGSAASPAIDADGRRLYTNDRAGNLVAMDLATGEVAWTHPLGFSPAGSPSITGDGRIVPTAGGGAWVVALRDAGDHAELLWERRDLTHLGVPAQTTDDGPLYVVVADPDGPGAVQLAVLDGPTGETLDLVEAPGSGPITIGTTIGPDGRLFFAGLTEGVFGFHPADG